MLTDSHQDKGLRRQLVEGLKQKGIDNPDILSAILQVPRHFFISDTLHHKAYEDTAIPIGCHQTISQPFTVAKQTSLLEVQANMKVLEIGTGSGYQAAILKQMKVNVYSIERQRDLYEHAKKLFAQLSLAIATKFGDGYLGWQEFAPYERILITCGAPSIPQALLQQLKIGGILVAPIGTDQQIMTKVVRQSENNYQITEHGSCSFVPMLENVNHL